MATVVSVKFRNRGKLYYFDPVDLTIENGTQVVVETAKGLEIGEAVQGNHEVEDARVVQPLRPVARIATDDDRRIAALCRQREKEAYVVCKRKIEQHGLEMKLVDVECAFDGSKILFFFSSDGRVDFRELVKDLAGVFRTRIELRQIGVRDEARMLGGLGICGRAFCCGTFMDEFAPVSTKMAKTQSMSLNPAKISGACGRLMCCLRYEQEAYEELVKNVPKNGAFVETPDGYGNVTQVNVLRQTVRVKLDGPGEDSIKGYEADEVAAIPGGRPRDGSQPPHVLVLKPKKPKEEAPETDRWIMPQMLAEEPAAKTAEATVKPKRSSNNRRRKKPNGPKNEGEKAAPAKTETKTEAKKPQQSRPNGKKPQQNRPEKKQGPKPEKKPAEKPNEKPADKPAAEKKPDGAKSSSRSRNRRYRGKGRGNGAPKDGAAKESGPKEG